MAVLCSIATGNWTAAATWGLVDSTSYLNAEDSTESLLTTLYSNTRSQAFTPGAITISHIAVKLCERIGTTGTISVSLRNSTLGLDDFVTGTEVTINVSDLPAALEADANGGWIVFKLASPVLLLAATNYQVQAKTSSTSQVDLYCNNTADNLSRMLVTTTTQAPVAGDDMVVAGERTGAGTGNSFTATMDETATTDYGAASTSLVTPALAICDRGTLTWGVTAATTYLLKISGNVIIYSGGTHNQGTSGTPVPSGSSTELRFDCGANVDFGLTVRNLGTDNLYGTKGVTAAYTKLTVDAAAAATSFTVLDTTGFQVGDTVAFATTTRTNTQCETLVIDTVPTSTTFTTTAGLVNAHSGTNDANGDIRGEVSCLTRNAKRNGASASLQAYIDIKPTAIVNWSKAEVSWLGSNTAFKRGITVGTTTGTFTTTLSSIHDGVVSNSYGFYIDAQTGGANTSITKNAVYSIALAGFSCSSAASALVFDDNIVIRGNSSGGSSVGAVYLTGTTITGSFKRNIVAGANREGFWFNGVNVLGTGIFSDLESHGNLLSGLHAEETEGTIGGTNRMYRNTTYGTDVTSWSKVPLVINALNVFGNLVNGVDVAGGANLTLPSFVANAGTTLTQPIGIDLAFFTGLLTVIDGSLGATNVHATGDVACSGEDGRLICHNTTLNSTNKVSSLGALTGVDTRITMMKYGGTAGDHRAWKFGGRTSGTQPAASLETDTTFFHAASPSLRMYPGSASYKLRSNTWHAAVANGGTLTASVRVRTSVSGDGAAYNGAVRARLIVLANPAAGISADTVLATASAASEGAANGAFELLSGTTGTVNDDAVLEFVVDCEGTTGWINVDDFSCPSVDPGPMKFWQASVGGPGISGVPAASGGVLVGNQRRNSTLSRR